VLFHLAYYIGSHQERSGMTTLEEIQDECHSFTLGCRHWFIKWAACQII